MPTNWSNYTVTFSTTSTNWVPYAHGGGLSNSTNVWAAPKQKSAKTPEFSIWED